MPDRTTATRDAGMSRRDLITRAAVAGTVAWAAPVVLESIMSPAGALTNVGYPCSYITVVYRVGEHTYAAKFASGATTCSGNATSSDGTFTFLCGGVQYTNTCSGNAVCADGRVIPSDPSCSTHVSWSGGITITAAVGVTIVFAVAHDGSYGGTKSRSICPASPQPGNSVTAPSCGGF